MTPPRFVDVIVEPNDGSPGFGESHLRLAPEDILE
jgi:hypothetical protein